MQQYGCILYLHTIWRSAISSILLELLLPAELTNLLFLPAGAKFCVLEAQLGYDIGKHALSSAVTANRKFGGKEAELKAAWAELTGHWTLGALLKPHKSHKLAAT